MGSGTLIVSGRWVFKLMDTHGLPLDIILDRLREEGKIMNTTQFIEAALKAGWKHKTIKAKLQEVDLWKNLVLAQG